MALRDFKSCYKARVGKTACHEQQNGYGPEKQELRVQKHTRVHMGKEF